MPALNTLLPRNITANQKVHYRSRLLRLPARTQATQSEIAMLRVLIADKQSDVADSTARMLGKFGHQTTAVYSGQRAVEVAAVLRPNVFLSEVMMPGMTGIEAGILVRLMLPSCRVILFAEEGLTAGLFARAESKGYVFETISKPIEVQVLVSRLRRPSTASPLPGAEQVQNGHLGERRRL